MTPIVMAAPTPNTIHLVISGVTQTEPTIGDTAIRRAKRNSPGAFWAVIRMAGSITGHHPGWSNPRAGWPPCRPA